jgi:membrane protein DedA with SNARE-associated domain
MNDWITSAIDSMGYFGIVLLMLLENIVPPIPSELIMPLAGFVASQGKLSFWGVIAAGTAGSVLGALPIYYLGRGLGRDRLRYLAKHHGHWLAVAPKDIDNAHEWFSAHCRTAVLLCRMIPGVRSLISLPAGVAEMPLLAFLGYTAVGSAAWATLLALAGKLLGENFSQIDKFVGPVAYVVIGGMLIAFIVRAIRIRRKNHSD